MSEQNTRDVLNNPRYQKLVKTRSRYSWTLTGMMLVVYFGYIYLVAFNKDWMSMPLGDGVMTRSIPLGIGVILFTIIITGIYVRRANSEFDALTKEILKELR